MGNVIFLKGMNIDLLVKNKEHVDIYVKWINDPRIGKFLSVYIPETIEVIKKEWFPEYPDEKNIWFEIWHKEDQKPIGMVGLLKIIAPYRRGEIGIFIGEIDYWGKGIGTEAAKMILDYAFNVLNLYKIVAEVSVTNTRSVAIFNKLGFIEEGHLKDHEFIDGDWRDNKIFGLINKEN